MKIVINRCFGGFGISKSAEKMYWELRGEPKPKDWYAGDRDDLPRNDPNLVKVVEKLGNKANGEYAKLLIVDVPDDVKWFIDEYDGSEHVAEEHRTWP